MELTATSEPRINHGNFVNYGQGFHARVLAKFQPDRIGGATQLLRYDIRVDSYLQNSHYRVEVWRDGWQELWTLDPHTFEHPAHQPGYAELCINLANRAIDQLRAYARVVLDNE